jgi:hypothetical protein
MVSSLDEIKKYNILFLLYPSGSSGEFLAYALSKCIDTIANPPGEWENTSRMKFADCLGRSLNAQDVEPDAQTVVDRFNLHLESTDVSNNRISVALVHAHTTGVDYITTQFSHAPVIEITTTDFKSQQFRDLAATEKIGPSNRNCFYHTQSDLNVPRHLRVNWSDLFLHDAEAQFDQITNFLNVSGDRAKFLELVKNYLARNQHLVEQLNES